MSILSHDELLDIMSPTITWEGSNPYSDAHAELFTKALACTVYPRLTAGNILTVIGDSSDLNISTSLSEHYTAKPNESLLFFVTDKSTIPGDFQEVKDIGAYLSDKYKVYQDAAARITIVQLQQSGSGGYYGNAFFRRFASAMPRLLPWLFKDHPLTPDELAYLRALSTPDTNSDTLSQMEEALYNKTDLPTKAVSKVIESVFQGTIDSRKQVLKNKIESRYRNIEDLRNQEKATLEDIFTLSAELSGLSNKDESSFITSMKDFFKEQKGIRVVPNGHSMRMFITTTLCNFNADDVQEYVFNGSYPYRSIPTSDKPDMRLLLKAIFVDRTIRVKMQACYEIDHNCHVTGIKNVVSESRDLVIPNSHINSYACFGGYGPMLTAAQNEMDFIAAISICQMSAGSLNLPERLNSDRFFDSLAEAYKDDYPVLLTSTDELVTPKQAIELLKFTTKEA